MTERQIQQDRNPLIRTLLILGRHIETSGISGKLEITAVHA